MCPPDGSCPCSPSRRPRNRPRRRPPVAQPPLRHVMPECQCRWERRCDAGAACAASLAQPLPTQLNCRCRCRCRCRCSCRCKRRALDGGMSASSRGEPPRCRKGAPGQAAARLRGAEERRPRGRAHQRASSSDSARLLERSERSERSELRDGPRARVPQGSRRAAPTASLKRAADCPGAPLPLSAPHALAAHDVGLALPLGRRAYLRRHRFRTKHWSSAHSQLWNALHACSCAFTA